MDTEVQDPENGTDRPESGAQPGQDQSTAASGDQLVAELGRLGRKFIKVVEVAWTSDQRHQIEQDLRSGLNTVVHSLEAGLQDVGEQEQTKEFVGKAEELADSVAEKVRTSELANELALSLAKGLHAIGDQLDRLARDMQTGQPPPAGQPASSSTEPETQGQEIPISQEPPESPTDA